MKNIPFVKYSKLFLILSGALALASLVLFIVWGVKPSIDFTGGSLFEISFTTARPSNDEVQKALDKLKLDNSVIQTTGDKGMIIRTNFLSEDEHQNVLKELRADFETKTNKLTESQFETIGAAVSQQLKTKAVWAVIFVNLSIILYVAYAFRKVSRPVASWKYGLSAIIAAIHDVLMVVGVFVILSHFFNTEVDIGFVVALLTVLGYSVNDTIVVYDRIRENLLRRSAGSFSEMIDVGLNETLMRSINTTLITLIPLLALYLLGGSTIHNFALALLVGIASGAYSSIFVASPLLAYIEKWQKKSV